MIADRIVNQSTELDIATKTTENKTLTTIYARHEQITALSKSKSYDD